MKDRLLAVAILVLPFGLFLFFWLSPGAVKTARDNPPVRDAAGAGALARQNSNPVAVMQTNFAGVPAAPAGTPEPLQFTNFAPAAK